MRNVFRVRPRRHSTRGPGHPFVRALAYVAGAVVAFAGVGAYEYVTSAFDHVHVADVYPILHTDRPIVPPTDNSKGQPLNILLMGSDSRAGANAAIGGANEGMRSDTTIIMHISADRTRIEFVSIPRDSWVKISQCTLFDGTVVKGRTTKFNAAFANGARNNNPAEAAACALNTIEDLTDIFFDDYVVTRLQSGDLKIDFMLWPPGEEWDDWHLIRAIREEPPTDRDRDDFSTFDDASGS